MVALPGGGEAVACQGPVPDPAHVRPDHGAGPQRPERVPHRCVPASCAWPRLLVRPTPPDGGRGGGSVIHPANENQGWHKGPGVMPELGLAPKWWHVSPWLALILPRPSARVTPHLAKWQHKLLVGVGT